MLTTKTCETRGYPVAIFSSFPRPPALHCFAGHILPNERLAHSAEIPRADTSGEGQPLYVYTIAQDGTRESYDEAMAAACLQGIINRKSPTLYVLSKTMHVPQYWLDMLSKEGRWLEGRELKPLADLDALARLAGRPAQGRGDLGSRRARQRQRGDYHRGGSGRRGAQPGICRIAT